MDEQSPPPAKKENGWSSIGLTVAGIAGVASAILLLTRRVLRMRMERKQAALDGKRGLLVLKNALTYDSSSANWRSTDIFIKNGRIMAIVADNEVSPLLETPDAELNCNGCILIPSLCDHHVHFTHWMNFESHIDLSHCNSTSEVLSTLSKAASQTPVSERPILVASRWGSPDFDLQELVNRRPLLDAAVPDGRPVLIYGKDLHTAWVNTAALEKLGWLDYSALRQRVGEDALPPIIHTFMNDGQEQPTGIVQELAMQRLSGLAESSGAPRFTRNDLIAAQQKLFSLGVTSVTSIEDFEGAETLHRYAEDGTLQLRVGYFLGHGGDTQGFLSAVERGERFPPAFPPSPSTPSSSTSSTTSTPVYSGSEPASPARSRSNSSISFLRSRLELTSSKILSSSLQDISGAPTPLNHFTSSGRLDFLGFKLFLDGSLGSRTAWMFDSYNDCPNQSKGVPLYSDEVFASMVDRSHALGYPVAVHAIGDAACRQAARVLADRAGQNSLLGEGSDRIEHFQLSDAETLRVLREAAHPGVTLSMQPCHLIHDTHVAPSRWGQERMNRAFQVESLLKQGSKVIFGSDAPVEPLLPLRNLVACDTIWNKEERPSRIEALRCSTLSGRLELHVGDVADLGAWPMDLLWRWGDELLSLKPIHVLANGKVVVQNQTSPRPSGASSSSSSPSPSSSEAAAAKPVNNHALLNCC